MWCGRCGWVSVCLRTLLHLGTLCRRTESQQAGPDTLLLWWSQGGGEGWMLDYRCTGQCKHHDNTEDSRTCCCIQASCQHPLLSLWFLCMSLLYKHFLSSPPPSNSGQSDPLYTTPGAWSQISLGGQDTTEPLQPSSPPWGPQTERVLCGLCLGPVWVHRHLTGEQDMIRGWRSGPFPVFRSGAPA